MCKGGVEEELAELRGEYNWYRRHAESCRERADALLDEAIWCEATAAHRRKEIAELEVMLDDPGRSSG
jgi:hypothetical protein